jgi:hypothetical protein
MSEVFWDEDDDEGEPVKEPSPQPEDSKKY